MSSALSSAWIFMMRSVFQELQEQEIMGVWWVQHKWKQVCNRRGRYLFLFSQLLGLKLNCELGEIIVKCLDHIIFIMRWIRLANNFQVQHTQWKLVKLDKNLMNFLMYVYFILVYCLCSVFICYTQFTNSVILSILEQYFLIQVLLNLIKWKLRCK